MPMTAYATAYFRNRQSVFNLKADLHLTSQQIQALLVPSAIEIEARKEQVLKLTADALSNPVVNINYLQNQGTLHHIYELIDSTGKAYIVKTNKDVFPIRSYNFYIDRVMMHTLQQQSLTALKIDKADCSREKCDFDYLVMEKAQGHPLIQYKERQEEFDKYVIALGSYLANIHSLPVSQYGLINAPILTDSLPCQGVLETWSHYIYMNLEEHLAYCVDHEIITNQLLNEINVIFEDAKSLIHVDHPALLHGDLNDHNIFIENNQLMLIDWEDALCGDPAFDIALWGTFVGHHEKLPLLLRGYQTVKPIADNFMLRYWLYYLRIIIAKTVVRYKLGYYKTDKIPAIERILPPLKEVKDLLSKGTIPCEFY